MSGTLSFGADDARATTLREFRDTVMAKSAAGEKLIDLYYSNGKRVVAFLTATPGSNIPRESYWNYPYR